MVERDDHGLQVHSPTQLLARIELPDSRVLHSSAGRESGFAAVGGEYNYTPL